MKIATLLMLSMATLASAQTEITVYNQGFALIKEVRELNLKQGRQSIAVENVAEQIETNSVAIKALGSGNPFEVLEQNYQYDLISPIAILNKAVGKRVTFNRVLPNGAKEAVTGVLVSSPQAVVGQPGGGGVMTWNGMVIKTDDGRILLNPSGEIEVNEIPEGLISKPTLLWLLESKVSGAQNVELSYLTRGMSWSADYVVTLDGISKFDLKGWVTMVNNSGATFENSKLKLLAGDVQRVQPRMMGGGRGGEMMDMAAKSEGFSEESLFEYHLYTLGRPATVKNNEQKQLSLLEAEGVPYEKKLIVDSMMNFGMYYPSESELGTGVIKPVVKIEFVNDEKFGMGMPLPAGKVKVYQRDKSGSVQMLGEDSINHTPRNERLSLTVGRSFDVVAERKRTNYRRINSRTFEETFEVEVRNRKTVADVVHVYERHYGEWKITNTSQDWIKLDSQTQQYLVKVGPNESKKVTYTVQTSW